MSDLPGKSPAQKGVLVCFACRLAVKKPMEFLRQHENGVCARCHAPLAFIDRYFKLPRRSDVRTWRKVQMLHESGWQTGGYGSSLRSLRTAKASAEKSRGANVRVAKQKRRRHAAPRVRSS